MAKGWYSRWWDRKKGDRQYYLDLAEISGGLPDKTFSDKIAFCTLLFRNRINHNLEQAHYQAEVLRRLKRKIVEDDLVSVVSSTAP